MEGNVAGSSSLWLQRGKSVRGTVTAYLCLVFASPVLAAPLPSADQIIQKEGRLAFTDGSSFYDFEKNGEFHSGPMGNSGRTIEGHWKPQYDNFPNNFVIRGKWSRVNGLTAPDDYRKMILSVYPESIEPKKTSHGDGILYLAVGAPDKMYRCYFTVEELSKSPRTRESVRRLRLRG